MLFWPNIGRKITVLCVLNILVLDVENARKLYEAADSEVDQLTAELQKIKDDLAIDYGTQREWLKLKDVCVEKDEGE